MELAREVPAFGLLDFQEPAGKHLKSLAGFLEFSLGLLALGNVTVVKDNSANGGVLQMIGADGFDKPARAAFMTKPILVSLSVAGGFNQFRKSALRARQVLRPKIVEDTFPQRVGNLVAEGGQEIRLR